MSDEADATQVAFEMLVYKKNHEATDTEEYIKNRWLSSQEVECRRETVTNALRIPEQS